MLEKIRESSYMPLLYIHFVRLRISSNDYLEVNPYHGCRTDDISLYHAYRTSLLLSSRIVSHFNETVRSNDSPILLSNSTVRVCNFPNNPMQSSILSLHLSCPIFLSLLFLIISIHVKTWMFVLLKV